MRASRSAFGWMSLVAVLSLVLAADCVELRPGVHYTCNADGGCDSIGGQPYACDPDTQLCLEVDTGQPGTDGGADAGTDGGTGASDAGSDAGSGGSDGGADGGPGLDAGMFVEAPPSCSDAGWCFENPLSLGGSLYAVRGSTPDDLWAVGDRGLALYWNGKRWSRAVPGANQALRGVGRVRGQWWAVGDNGTLLFWNGSQWESRSTGLPGTLNGVSSSPSGDAGLIVGDGGTVLGYDGGGWSPQAVPNAAQGGMPPNLNAAWLPTDREAWAVGDNGIILHGLDGQWSSAPSSAPTSNMLAVHGATPDAGWAVGANGTVARWDGSSWLNAGPVGAQDLTGVWLVGPKAGWAVGLGTNAYRLDAGIFEALPSGAHQGQLAVWGSALDDYWAVGQGGSITHWDGTTWTESTGGWTGDAHAVWGSDAGVLAAGQDFHVTRNPATAQWDFKADPGLGSVFGLGGNNGIIWAVGGGKSIHRLKGNTWSADSVDSNVPNTTFNAVYATANSYILAVGTGGAIAYWNVRDWTVQDSGTNLDLIDVWAGPGGVWAVGSRGAVIHLAK